VSFVHLHLHTSFSPLEGVDKIGILVKRARELGMPALAVTDTDGLYGAVHFYRSAREAGIRPIFGAELTDPGSGRRAVVLARNWRGFAAVCRLVTARKLRRDFSLARALAGAGDDVFILSRDVGILSEVVRLRGRENVYAELCAYGRGDRQALERLGRAAGKLGLPLVATQDVHFAYPDGYRVHRVLAAIRENCTVDTLPPGSTVPPGAFLRSPEEIKVLYRDFPAAVENSLEIAADCRVELELGKVRLPRYPLPTGESSLSLLRKLVIAGAAEHYRRITPEIAGRIDYELGVIDRLGYCDYFLVVRDIVDYANSRGIPTVGRGSAANSIVSYLLRITHVDPIKYNLYFERFLNPERGDCPDIDLDFPWNRRDEVLQYVYRRFGSDRVTMVSTHVTFAARSAVREVGKALGLPRSVIGSFNRKLPYFTGVADIRRAAREYPECRDLPLDEEPWRSILDIAGAIDGHLRHLSVHVGGIVVAPEPITNFVPLERTAKGLVVTQYDMYPVEDMGLVKIDLLGNRSLGVIVDTVKDVRNTRGEVVDFERIDPRDDPETKSLIREGRSIGCFYIESPAMRSLLKKLRCDSFELLVAASSIIRPGVSHSGVMRQFIDRHNGREPVRYLHPKLKSILGETYGVMVYQEDVLKVAHELAGMTLAQADNLRRCMGKKRNWEAMENYRAEFFAGARRKGIAPRIIAEIWRQIESFAGYAFCKAHSASFALVSFQAAYLKAHYPAEFMAAVMSNQGGFYHTGEYLEECRRMGLEILPPDVNRSRWRFTGGDGRVRVGLMQVKGLKAATAARIVRDREKNGPYTSLADFLERTGADRREAENLVRCGAFDFLRKSRPELLWELAAVHPPGGRGIFAAAGCRPDLARLAGYTEREKIALEEEILGLTPSAHPLRVFAGELRELRERRRLVLARDLGRFAGRRVGIVGWLVTAKPTRTVVRGEPMKFLSLEDETGTFEVTLFPAAYRRFGHLIDGRGPYLVWGRVEEDSGSLSLTADRVERPLGVGTGD